MSLQKFDSPRGGTHNCMHIHVCSCSWYMHAYIFQTNSRLRGESDPVERPETSNNFRWLNAVKEAKIVFFVRDNSGENFLTAHAARRNFSEVIRRACTVVVYSWFSHLHGKFCALVLRTFPARPAPFEPRVWLVGTVGSQRPVLMFGFSWLHAQVFSHQLVGYAGCKCRELSLDR